MIEAPTERAGGLRAGRAGLPTAVRRAGFARERPARGKRPRCGRGRRPPLTRYYEAGFPAGLIPCRVL